MTRVRSATFADTETIRAVARSAGERFRDVVDGRISRCADDPPPAAADLVAPIEAGRVLVTHEGSLVVGFVVVSVVDGRAHIDEVSVAGDFQGRGHGTDLLTAVERWSDERGLDGISLTTFRDVPWNHPYYERRGYSILGDDQITPGLRALIAREASEGLASELRVAMHRPGGAPRNPPTA